jgi:hypothetical protein
VEGKSVRVPGEVSRAAETEYEAVVTTKREKSAEVIVPDWIYTVREGLNLRRC